MADNRITLHRRLWGTYRQLPRLVQVWILLAAVGGLTELQAQLAGPSDEERVRDAVTAVVREATGPAPGSTCSSLSTAGLTSLLRETGSSQLVAAGSDALAACRSLAVRVRAQATQQEVSNVAAGSVRAVQFHSDGSALVFYLAADHHLGAKLTMKRSGSRWLIDDVTGGEVATGS